MVAHKDLFLLRHAEAVAPTGYRNDAERLLTAQGINDAVHLGTLWHQQAVCFDQIVCSPAVRTCTTARILAAHTMRAPESIALHEVLYNGSLQATMEVLQAWPRQWQQVLLVSHAPLLHALLAHLTGSSVTALPPCGYVHVQIQVATWSHVAQTSGQRVVLGYP